MTDLQFRGKYLNLAQILIAVETVALVLSYLTLTSGKPGHGKKYRSTELMSGDSPTEIPITVYNLVDYIVVCAWPDQLVIVHSDCNPIGLTLQANSPIKKLLNSVD